MVPSVYESDEKRERLADEVGPLSEETGNIDSRHGLTLRMLVIFVEKEDRAHAFCGCELRSSGRRS